MLNNLFRAFLDREETTVLKQQTAFREFEGGTLAKMHYHNYETSASVTMELPKRQDLRWLGANENKFGRAVFDCRKVALHFNSSTRNQEIIQRFEKLQRSNGKEFDLQLPNNPIKYRFEANYNDVFSFPEGAVSKAVTMEQKWNIYRWGNRLYFVKSWTGELKYVAVFADSVSTLSIDHIYTDEDIIYKKDSSYIGKRLDFLINSHIFQKEMPHPLPSFLDKEDEQTIISFSFSEFGNKGCFATFDY